MGNMSEAEKTMLQSIYTICVNPENRPPEEIFHMVLTTIDIAENIDNTKLPPMIKEMCKPDPKAINDLKLLLVKLTKEYPLTKALTELKERIKSVLINEYYGTEEMLDDMVKKAYLNLLMISPMQIEM